MSARWKPGPAGWICILLVLAVWVIYLPVVGFEFTNYDDTHYVTKNPPVRAGLNWESIVWAFTHSHSGNWHPLTWISHMADCQLFDMRAGGHHLTNLLLHTANTLLLFGLLRALTAEVWRSGMVAALFGLHPAHVESVAWVAERKDVLSTCFGLLTLLAYAYYARNNGREEALIRPNALGEKDQSLLTGVLLKRKDEGKRQPSVESVCRNSRETAYSNVAAAEDGRAPSFGQHALTPAPKKGWFALALVSYALSLMSKPMLVTLPFVMLLLDYWPMGRFSEDKKQWRRALAEKVPFLALAATSCAVTVLVQHAENALSPLSQTPLSSRVMNAAVCYVLYLWKVIWPMHLAALYPEVRHWPGSTVLLAFGFLAAVTGLVCWRRERRPWLLMGWLWFVGMLVPVIGLVKVGRHLITDRYTYLPSVGLFIMAVWEVGELLRSPAMERPRKALAVALVLGCMALAQPQVMCWRNTETLFRHALSVTTGNYVAYTSLAFHLVERKERVEAEKCLRAALAINPNYEAAWTKLATLLVDEGRFNEAIGYCQKALSADPKSAGAHSTWGVALIRQGQTNDAVAHYEAALRCQPDFADAHYNLGNALASQGQIAAASEQYQAAVRADPYSADYHNNLAYMLVRKGEMEQAVDEFRAALVLAPDSWHARYGLGDALVRQGNPAEGALELARVIESKPDLASARLQYGIALAAQGQVTQAIAALSEAVRRKPDFALAHYHLGRLLSENGENGEAVQHYREAVKLSPNFADSISRLAWLLSVSPDPAVRNGAEAVELAERACKVSRYQQPGMIRILAAAYAEAGRFDEAVKTAESACGSMAAVPLEAQKCGEMLERFRAGQPWREGK